MKIPRKIYSEEKRRWENTEGNYHIELLKSNNKRYKPGFYAILDIIGREARILTFMVTRSEFFDIDVRQINDSIRFITRNDFFIHKYGRNPKIKSFGE